MVKEILLASDHHFGDKKINSYLNPDGSKVRPYSSLEEMHEDIIQKHNSIVRPQDKCYFLGDVVIDKLYFSLLNRMNGHKKLVKGNHDIYTNLYDQYFESIHGVKVFADRKVFLNHIPIHPDSLKPGWVNITGHLHSSTIKDSRYYNVCLEQINFTPININELLSN